MVKVSALSRGGWVKNIYGRAFYWPSSLARKEAERQAGILAATGKRLRALGLPWSEVEIDKTLGVGGVLPVNRAKANDRRERERVERETRERAEAKRREGDTLHKALDDFVAHLLGREVSQAYKARGRAAVAMAKRLTVDVPLHRFDLERLGALADALNAGAYAHATIKTTLHFCREALDFLDTRGRWEMTRRAEKLLKPRRQKTAVVVEVFTGDELQNLYANASPTLQACMMLGLNCGFASAEISTLTHEHLLEENGRWWVVKNRTKTGRAGSWELWPETVAALKAAGWSQGEGLVVRSARGGPLCHYCAASGERADALGRAWHRLTKRTECRRLGFKHLRKTGATWIADASDETTAQRWLAHAGGSVARRHYLAYSESDGVDKALAVVRKRHVVGMVHSQEAAVAVA